VTAGMCDSLLERNSFKHALVCGAFDLIPRFVLPFEKLMEVALVHHRLIKISVPAILGNFAFPIP
jgi:hypothetical protein